MPGRSRPSFLKRQKEQARAQRATQKRAAKQARRDRRTDEIVDDSVLAEISTGVDTTDPDARDAGDVAEAPDERPAEDSPEREA